MKGKSILISVISSLAASLCCIAPFVTLMSGVSGITIAFSWLEPVRPFLIGTSLISLGLAWYAKIHLGKDECGCESKKKKTFFQPFSLLVPITVASILLMTFPLYAQWFDAPSKPVIASSTLPATSVKEVEFMVTGMGCASCEQGVENEVSKLSG